MNLLLSYSASMSLDTLVKLQAPEIDSQFFYTPFQSIKNLHV